MVHPDVTDLAWAAGILDGEGCICITFRKKPGVHQLFIRVATKDSDISPAMHNIFGGSLWTDGKGHGTIWQVSGAKAAQVAAMVYPYLKHKQPQAQIAIEYGPTVQLPGQRKSGILEKRWKLYHRLRELHTYSIGDSCGTD